MKNTKKIILAVVLILGGNTAFAQVGMNTSTPHPSAVLDVNGTNKGILFPRMTTAQKLAIVSPANGLMVYDTDVHAHYIHIDGEWLLQKSEVVIPNRVFLVAQPLVAGGEINTPTGGGSAETDSNSNFSRVEVTMAPGLVSGVEGAAILSSGFPMTVGTSGTYLLKISGRFRKIPSNDLNMKTRLILRVNGMDKLNTYFHLPNAANASSTKTNYIQLNLVEGDIISIQVKKDRFVSTSSATLHGKFSDIVLEIEKLP
jgi:hypothetical protein